MAGRLQFFLFVFKINKKVLLRERKRHTARRVVSTPSVVLTGYPLPPGRVPPAGYPPPPLDLAGTPPAGPGRYPPQLDLAGYPPPPGWIWQGIPPPGVCPMAFWVMLQSIMGYGYPPPPRCGLTKWNYYLPVVLRTRAVISIQSRFVATIKPGTTFQNKWLMTIRERRNTDICNSVLVSSIKCMKVKLTWLGRINTYVH